MQAQLPLASREVKVEQGEQSGEVCITLKERLDEVGGQQLLEAADAVAANGGTRITVDLREINTFTEGGVKAATACCRLASGLPKGVSFVASTGPSRQALLEILHHG